MIEYLLFIAPIWLQAIGVVTLFVLLAKVIERFDRWLDRRSDRRRRNQARPWRIRHDDAIDWLRVR